MSRFVIIITNFVHQFLVATGHSREMSQSQESKTDIFSLQGNNMPVNMKLALCNGFQVLTYGLDFSCSKCCLQVVVVVTAFRTKANNVPLSLLSLFPFPVIFHAFHVAIITGAKGPEDFTVTGS